MLKKLFLILLIITTGCSQSLYLQGRKLSDEGSYDRAIEVFYSAIEANPQSAAAWRELGVAFFKKGDLEKAEEALKQAARIEPDARSNLYIGLTYEKEEAYDQAIEAFRAALALKPRGKTNDLVRAHLDYLISKRIEKEVNLALENESSIDAADIPENTIAVVDFDDQHLPLEMAPISKGLAELTSNDLAKIKSLRVIERLKIEEIISELKLASSQYADPATAPRMGRLLGSRNIVTGSAVGIGEEGVRLSGVVVNTADSSAEMMEPTDGTLPKIFEAQKEFVFRVINNLGITLKPEERDAISAVPTESQLAFLAYCRGLDYRSKGMLKEARSEFKNAAIADPNFIAANFQAKELSYVETPGFEVSASPEQFESVIVEVTDSEMLAGQLDRVLNSSLLSSGFLRDPELLNRFTSRTDVPPQTEELKTTVIIRGNLDANQ